MRLNATHKQSYSCFILLNMHPVTHHFDSTASRGTYTSGTDAWELMTRAEVVLPDRREAAHRRAT
jgi:hypothetical protein